MKQFFLNLAKYTIVLAIILIVVSFIFRSLYESGVQRATHIPENKKVLVLGDSHMEAAINDNMCDEFINKSYSAEGYYYNYLKLLDILERDDHNLTTLLIGFSHVSFNGTRDNVLIGANNGHYYNKYAYCLKRFQDRPSVHGMSVDKSEYYVQYINKYLGIPSIDEIESLLFSRTILTDEYIGRHTTFDNGGNLDTDLSSNHDWVKGNTSEVISLVQLRLLELIAEKATDSGIQVVLLNTPCHEAHDIFISELQKKRLDEIALDLEVKYGAIYLNYIDFPLSDECYFDTSHLNNKGAEIITLKIQEELERLNLM